MIRNRRKTVLVTGGLGYLGGRICKVLRGMGVKVVIGTSRKNSNIPLDLSSCTLKKISLKDYSSLEKACKNIDIVIHLASMNANESKSNPEDALIVNGLGTLNLLNAARASGVKNFIYFSTVHVYSEPLVGKLDESVLPKPVHDYSITHRLAEDYVLKEDKNGFLCGAVFRLSNVVGSPVSKDCSCWKLVANDLCKQAVINKCISLSSNENIMRDYVSISDICGVISDAISNEDILKNINGEVINITSGISMSLKDLSSLVAERCKVVLGYHPHVNFCKKNTEYGDNELEISNRKACSMGFVLDSNLSHEIDNLLLNSKEWFMKSGT